MTIRKLKNTEADLSIKMSEYAFQYTLSNTELEEERELIQANNTWVVEENDVVVSKATILPLHTYIHGIAMPMGGISGVATWPEYRRKGYVKKLLFHSLKEMKDNGQLLSFLYPASIPFYRQFGWELFSDTQTVTLTREQLPIIRDVKGVVRRVEKDYSVIHHVYHTWAKKYNGTLVRTEDWWKTFILRSKKHTLAVYYNTSCEVKGYMLYHVKNETMTIEEIIWINSEARDGLFSFIANHDSMIKQVKITTTADGGIPFVLPDPKVERELRSYFMARIVDVKSFLKAYPFEKNENIEPLIFHVSDEFCPWNDGTYFIKHEDDTQVVTFHPTKKNTGSTCQHAPKKGLSLSIQALSTLLMGYKTATLLYHEGFIDGKQEEIAQLENCIKTQPSFIYDFF
ncbi:GNAT family N-acetyltransferase [Evansella cellulosilytica]|uniref:GCN5-related N-acetyltransferase n=1 Tax=Evansella cellulosilytica (strain ATCC 21833 / DSM 2522 / FERM P-1141 / JCM 9156 / N-4) TaxID=649639 RepID=E6U062_EVAC2|nr:GNAT family N-acetyltransferase [Evansella cellulosilytica]ADU29066.1 GCN5-related N-acetyltransferase [Evansella cellulosilytica DSM 2522]